MDGMAGMDMGSKAAMGGQDMAAAMADSASLSHLSWTCDGRPWTDTGADKTGSWTGHFVTGAALLLWATHWMHGVYRAWFTQTRQQPFQSRSTWSLPLIPASWPVEGVLKVVVSFCGIFAQLWWAHGEWRSNICPSNTTRAGHFWAEHIYSYQNAWVLFAFMVSGIVDVVAALLDLPSNTDGFFTAAAFGLNAMILSSTPHMDMLQDMLYFMLFIMVAGTALFALAEIAFPEAFFASCGKVYCTFMQGIWYIAIARFLYGDVPAWSTNTPLPDMAPAMFSPVPFVFWMNATSFGMFLSYLLFRWVYDGANNEVLQSECAAERALFQGNDVHDSYDQDGVHVPGGLLSLLGGPQARGSHSKGAAVHEMTPLVGKGGV